MPSVQSEFALLRHPHLAALAISARPAWLWTTDGSRLLWANSVGAAIFGANSWRPLTARRFDGRDARTSQIVRLAATLPSGAQQRLERLRGLGAGFNRALTCMCSRIVVGDGSSAVLVAAMEPAGPALTLRGRLDGLFGDSDDPVAAFATAGVLVHANPAAQMLLVGSTTLAALGLERLAAAAVETGAASGSTRLAGETFDVVGLRLGRDADQVIAVRFSAPPRETRVPPQAPPRSEPAHPEPHSTRTLENVPEKPAAEIPAALVTPTDLVRTPTETADLTFVDRRHPLRFVWQTDADGRFAVGSDEFVELVGPRIMAAFGRPWSDVAAELKLDPEAKVAKALGTRETWSGIVVAWPVDDSETRLPVELSGLPVFDRDRNFRGYRGFGVCRDIDRINALAQARRTPPGAFVSPPGTAPPPVKAALPGVAERPQPAEDTAKSAVGATPYPTESVEPQSLSSVPQHDRATPSVQQPAANVVPFRHAAPPEPKSPPALSPGERKAFRELAQELSTRLRAPQPPTDDAEAPPDDQPAAADTAGPATAATALEVLDRIPIGILIYRHDALLFANRYFLEWSGFANLDSIAAAGGLNALVVPPSGDSPGATGGVEPMTITTRRGDRPAVEGRLIAVPWNGASAVALIVGNGHGRAESAQREMQRALGVATADNRDLKSMLDAAADGIVLLDAKRRVLAVNSRAAILCGKTAADIVGRDLSDLFAPESARAAQDYFDRVARGMTAGDQSLELNARSAGDRPAPMAMTLAPIENQKFCAVFRDTTARRRAEEELRNIKRELQRAAAMKAEFLGRVSHEIRTPLNAMTGFAEVIMAERFGPIGNARYRDYVKDIHAAGTQLVGMLNDLLDLSKVETGQIDLSFANTNLNELTQQCVGIMQPQANKARIIIRTALTLGLPLVIADERSLRQIVLNLLSNSIKLTGPGGQVIVSTVLSDAQEAVLRVRDTGVGMSERDIEAALEPFEQTATSGSLGSGGTGFGLPLTKALARANRANFSIKSAPNAGTLVEIAFPPSRVVAG